MIKLPPSCDPTRGWGWTTAYCGTSPECSLICLIHALASCGPPPAGGGNGGESVFVQAPEPALLRPTGGVPPCRWGRRHNIPKVLPRCQCGPLLVVAHDHTATATTAAATHCIHDTTPTYCYDLFRKVDAVECKNRNWTLPPPHITSQANNAEAVLMLMLARPCLTCWVI